MRDMNINRPYLIREVQEEDSIHVIEFMMRIRKEVFPMLSQELPPDLLQFNEHYIKPNNAAIFAAFFEDGTVLGTIGICQYDGRFKQLEEHYNHSRTAEIVKCYIAPEYRRLGVGSLLFNRALRFCEVAGYEKVYLHTHPFLPGAVPFWKSRGFEERLKEDDPVWNTLHMDRQLRSHDV